RRSGRRPTLGLNWSRSAHWPKARVPLRPAGETSHRWIPAQPDDTQRSGPSSRSNPLECGRAGSLGTLCGGTAPLPASGRSAGSGSSAGRGVSAAGLLGQYRGLAIGTSLLVVQQPGRPWVKDLHRNPLVAAAPVFSIRITRARSIAGEDHAGGVLEEAQPLVIKTHAEWRFVLVVDGPKNPLVHRRGVKCQNQDRHGDQRRGQGEAEPAGVVDR